MMSSTNEEDPFLQVQADVLTQLSTTRPLFTSYLRIRSLSNSGTPPPSSSSSSPELSSARSELETAIASLAEDLADLAASVRAVEVDPHRYGLEVEEVVRRKRLVQEVGGEIDDMREELAKPLASRAHQHQQPRQRRASVGVVGDEDPLAGEGAGDSYGEFEQQQQLRMMHEQDEQLDGVFQTVGNLRQQANDMGRELEEQAEMLEVVDTLADRVGGRLQTGIQKVGYVMKRNEDRMSSCCIGLLILILIILLILVLII